MLHHNFSWIRLVSDIFDVVPANDATQDLQLFHLVVVGRQILRPDLIYLLFQYLFLPIQLLRFADTDVIISVCPYPYISTSVMEDTRRVDSLIISGFNQLV